MRKTILIEAKSGKVLEVLDSIKDAFSVPEILENARRDSNGWFYPAEDKEGKYRQGETVDFELLLVPGDVISRGRVMGIMQFERSIMAEINPRDLLAAIKGGYTLLIAGIKGQHKIGDIIRL